MAAVIDDDGESRVEGLGEDGWGRARSKVAAAKQEESRKIALSPSGVKFPSEVLPVPEPWHFSRPWQGAGLRASGAASRLRGTSIPYQIDMYSPG